MNRKLLAIGFACACSGTVVLNAHPQDTQPATPLSGAAVTVEGCLMREADVPGRTPVPADQERVKRDDDYILTQTAMVKGTAPTPSSGSPAADKPTGTSGAAPLMFKVEKISTEQLASYRGQRVQIDGTFRYPERATNVVSPATDLVKLDGTSIRSVRGDCGPQ
jgi:hypothetical protein